MITGTQFQTPKNGGFEGLPERSSKHYRNPVPRTPLDYRNPVPSITGTQVREKR